MEKKLSAKRSTRHKKRNIYLKHSSCHILLDNFKILNLSITCHVWRWRDPLDITYNYKLQDFIFNSMSHEWVNFQLFSKLFILVTRQSTLKKILHFISVLKILNVFSYYFNSFQTARVVFSYPMMQYWFYPIYVSLVTIVLHIGSTIAV